MSQWLTCRRRQKASPTNLESSLAKGCCHVPKGPRNNRDFLFKRSGGDSHAVRRNLAVATIDGVRMTCCRRRLHTPNYPSLPGRFCRVPRGAKGRTESSRLFVGCPTWHWHGLHVEPEEGNHHPTIPFLSNAFKKDEESPRFARSGFSPCRNGRGGTAAWRRPARP